MEGRVVEGLARARAVVVRWCAWGGLSWAVLASCSFFEQPALSDPRAWSNRRELPDEQARGTQRPEAHSKASVVASSRTLAPGLRFHLALLISIEDGYWVPLRPPTGGAEPSLKVVPPSGFVVGPQLAPRAQVLPGSEDELGYGDLTAWFVEVQAPPDLAAGDRHSFSVSGEWTVCSRKCRIEDYRGLALLDVDGRAEGQGFDRSVAALLASATADRGVAER